jgi:uncharacterized protein (DUF736 family)
MIDQPRMIRLTTLWERTSSKGTTYFSGFLGDCQLLLFKGDEITRPNGEVVQTWKLMIQERDPGRRPPAHQAERGRQTAEASREIGAAWSRRQREP